MVVPEYFYIATSIAVGIGALCLLLFSIQNVLSQRKCDEAMMLESKKELIESITRFLEVIKEDKDE